MSLNSAPPMPLKAEAKADRELARRTRRNAWDQKLSPYLYISPFFLLFALVGLFPLVYTAFVSVHDWNLIGGKGDFVGLENYQQVLQQPLFWKALRNTFSIFLLSSVPQVLIGLFLAAMLDANLRAKTFWRMGVLLPYVVMPVAVGMIFNKIFADQSGMANAILAKFGIEPIASSPTSPAWPTRSWPSSASNRSPGTPTSWPATSRSRPWSTSAGPDTPP
jgi:cellobiose transport system permease protein